MRIVFFCIGAIAVVCGIGLVIATALGKLTPLTGYSAGLAVVLGGTVCFTAGKRNYRGHWSFVTGVVLVTLAFAAVGGEIDDYRLNQGTSQDLGFGLFLAVMFLTFGILSLWSAHKLHRCVVALEKQQQQKS
jgi:Na+-transporting NADH:ubiquinone oxidoreductase subunit NqrB